MQTFYGTRPSVLIRVLFLRFPTNKIRQYTYLTALTHRNALVSFQCFSFLIFCRKIVLGTALFPSVPWTNGGKPHSLTRAVEQFCSLYQLQGESNTLCVGATAGIGITGNTKKPGKQTVGCKFICLTTLRQNPVTHAGQTKVLSGIASCYSLTQKSPTIALRFTPILLPNNGRTESSQTSTAKYRGTVLLCVSTHLVVLRTCYLFHSL
jgi:hypothetical protein